MLTIELCHVSLLPEVIIEAAAESDNNQCAYDIEKAPTLLDGLLEIGREGDGIHLLLRRCGCEETHSDHQ